MARRIIGGINMLKRFSFLRNPARLAMAVALSLILTASGCAVSGGVTVSPAPDAYEYPVQPGTPAWASLTTRSEMLAVCQVPEDRLARMSAAGLVETVLSCPLIGDFMAYNNPQDGLNALSRQCNAIRELLNRPGAGSVLLEKYLNLNPAGYPLDCSVLDKGKHCASLATLEVLLGNPSIQLGLTKKERDRLQSAASDKYQSKLDQPDVYSPFSLELSANLAGSLSGHLYAPRDYASYVLTPKGTPVSVYTMEFELGRAETEYLNYYVERYYPNAERVSDASRRYNCHSFTWYMQSPNDKWMDAPNQLVYFTDGSFRYVADPQPGTNFLRIMYGADDHSALVEAYNSDTDIICSSKWGTLPIMRHQPDYTPYDSSVLLFFAPESSGLGVPYSNLFPATTAPPPAATEK
jgi:hypothetical protein